MTDEKKRNVVLDPQRFFLAEAERQFWVINAPEGAKPEDLEKPEFWSLVAMRMSPYARIEVRADDGTWWAEVLILGCDRTWARAKILQKVSLTSSDVSQTQAQEKYYVKFGGPQHKWRVIRHSDGAVVKNECQTKDEAEIWMKEHEKTVG